MEKMNEYYTSEENKSKGYPGQLSSNFQSLLEEEYAHVQAEQCCFYHTVELPGGELYEGGWDLRGGEKVYLGYVRFAGQRVLDLGTATGHLTYYMEADGAEVVAFDIAPSASQDLLPFTGVNIVGNSQAGAENALRVRNGWWYVHRQLKSRSKAVYGNIYQLPPDLGKFDISIFGCILQHLSNPFAALREAAAITDKAIIVTESLNLSVDFESSLLTFNPTHRPDNLVDWWGLTPGAIVRMLKVLGFGETSVFYNTQKHRPMHDLSKAIIDAPMFTVIGERRAGSVPRYPTSPEDKRKQEEILRRRYMDNRESKRIESLQLELQTIKQSMTWRLTRPLRRLLNCIKKFHI